MKQLLIVLALLTCSAESCQKGHNGATEGGHGAHKAVNAPEIDAGSAIAGLTLLAGALIVMRGRK
jgi:hypothetical protein